MKGLLAAAALALLVAGNAGAAPPTDAEQARTASALYRDLMSPYCPGRTLADCPSPEATKLRSEIRARLDAGASVDQVRDDLERRFGGAVSGVPGAVGWILPGIGLLAGGILLARVLTRIGPGSADEPEEP